MKQNKAIVIAGICVLCLIGIVAAIKVFHVSEYLFLVRVIRATDRITVVGVRREFIEGLAGSVLEYWNLPDGYTSEGEIDGLHSELVRTKNAIYRRTSSDGQSWSDWEEVASPFDERPFSFLKEFKFVSRLQNEEINSNSYIVLDLEMPRGAVNFSYHDDHYQVWLDPISLLPVQAKAWGYWNEPAIQNIYFSYEEQPRSILPPR